MAAPAIRDPPGSVTSPTMVALLVCEKAIPVSAMSAHAPESRLTKSLDIIPLTCHKHWTRSGAEVRPAYDVFKTASQQESACKGFQAFSCAFQVNSIT